MTPLDTTSCESEPIRYPGAVQPHGALVVLAPEGDVVEAASESCASLLGLAAEAMLGHSFARLIGETIPAERLAPADDEGARPPIPLTRNGVPLRLRPSHNEAGQVLLDIEAADPDSTRVQEVIYQCRREIARLRRLSGIPAITAAAAAAVRAITGFDRVMLYHFDAAWNGEVIAEARIDTVEPYLGLNFPASDIPRQARELFQLSRVRQIPDVQYRPSALLARRRDSNSIDLGRSCLRSVSPIHIEYLTNMKVRATLVGALEVEGVLWGLVSCQNSTEPKYFSPPERDALGWLFEDIAALIESTLIRERREREYGLALRRRRLVDTMGARDFRSLMRQDSGGDLLEVVGADGFALLVEDTLQTLGATPAPERIRALQRRRLALGADPTFFVTNTLSRDLDDDTAAIEESGVAGAIFVSLRDRPGITMIWFRNERRRSVRWAGNPEQAHFIDESGRISPRTSFSQFLENIHGQSQPWTQAEIDAAGELGALIEIEIQHRYKTELGILQTVLSRINEAILVTEPNFEPGQSPTVLWVSPAFERLSGYTAEELQNLRTNVLFGPTTAAEAERMHERFLHREAVRTEVLRHTKAGTPFWVDMDVLPVLDPAGQVGQLISIERDITERRQMEESLRKLSTAIEQSPASVMITDLDANIEYVNPRFTEITGYTAAEVAGHNSRLIPSDHTPPATTRAVWDQLRQGRIWTGERLNRRKSGALYWEESHIAPVKDPEGRITHYVAVNIDITERKATEQALRESEAFVKTILDSIPQNICVLDEDGRIVAVNTAWCRFAAANDGCALADGAMRLNYREVCLAAVGQPAGDEAAEAWAGIADVLARRRPHFVLDYPCNPPGETGWFRMSVYPMQSPCQGAVVAHENITERKLMELSLDYERTQLRTLLETIPDLVWLKDPQGRYLTCNAAFQRYLGRPAAAILGRTDDDVLDPAAARLSRAHDAQVIASAAPCVTDETLTFAGDERRAFMSIIRTPMRDPAGALVGVLGIARDITERVDAEARLKVANRELADQGRILEQRVIERTEQLRQLAVKATLAEERERQAIAADLHDDLGQMLHVARIKLGSLGKARGAVALRLRTELAALLAEASGLVRSLASQLSPPVLRDLGLVAALGWLADEIERVYGLKVLIRDDGAAKPLTSAQEAILFRAVRELLINVFKHARTDLAWVEVRIVAGWIFVTVTDRGIGIAANADALPPSKGFGLVSLRERIAFLKGAMAIAPHPEGGTIVTLSLPLDSESEMEAGR